MIRGVPTYTQGLLNCANDESVDRTNLPQAFSLPDGMKPVIWITANSTNFDWQSKLLELEKYLKPKLQLSNESVTILGNFYQTKTKIMGEARSKWKSFEYKHFNGGEDDIVVVLESYDLKLRAITRARKLLIIMTYGEAYIDFATEYRLKCWPMMQVSALAGFVTKFPLQTTNNFERPVNNSMQTECRNIMLKNKRFINMEKICTNNSIKFHFMQFTENKIHAKKMYSYIK